MIEPRFESSQSPARLELDLLQQRANQQRQRYKQASLSFANMQASVRPFFESPFATLQRLPRRYALHAVVALVVPAALALSQLGPQALQEQAATRSAVVAEAPLSLGPVSFEGSLASPAAVPEGIVGDPPILESEAIPVPLSLTSRSEALAPLVVPAAIAEGNEAKLRNGPSLEYDEVGRLGAGADIEVIGRYGEWLQVRQSTSQDVFWVASAAVALDRETFSTLFEVQAQNLPAVPPAKVATVRDEGLRLRDGPGTDYVRMTSLDAGTELTLVEQYQDWLHVDTGTTTGWVSAEFLAVGEGIIHRVPVTETIPDPNPSLIASVTENSVNLRGGPGTAYGKVGALDSGTQVDLLARHDDWYKVSGGGTEGWMFADFLDVGAMVQRRVAYTNDIPALPVAAAPVRAAPGASAANSGNNAAPAAPVAAAPAPAPAPAPVYAPASGDVAGFAMQFVGYPYVYGGASPGGFDCSGLTSYVYRQFGIHLPRTAASQFSTSVGASIGNMGNLAPGDLVFFAGTAGPGISHVAIYVGGGRIVHALMPGLGVQVSNLYEGYWMSHYYGAIRPYR